MRSSARPRREKPIQYATEKSLRIGSLAVALGAALLVGEMLLPQSNAHAQSPSSSDSVTTASSDQPESQRVRRRQTKKLSTMEISAAVLAEPEPWDFSPYRVLIWIVSDNPDHTAETLQQPVHEYLDRDFAALWRLTIADAPESITAMVRRDIGGIDFTSLTAADSVVAVKRDHEDIIRIRFAEHLSEYLRSVPGTADRIAEVKRLAGGNSSELETLLKPIDGDAIALQKMWSDTGVEALLVSRGMAGEFAQPKAKLISPTEQGQVVDAFDDYDKIFLVHIAEQHSSSRVTAVEIDTLMQCFGPPVDQANVLRRSLPQAVGRVVTRAFGPVMRIDEAGTKTASGLIRAGGLIQSEDSPAWIRTGDVLQPMVRKNDRNGRAIAIGPIEWAYLMVLDAEKERRRIWLQRCDRAKAKGDPPPPEPDESVDKSRGGVRIEMAAIHAGRVGGLQGRKNNRTFRTAIKVRPVHDETMVRLHAKGDPEQPLVGYEVYEKELDSRSMSLVGRTDWNGRLFVARNESPMRLFYVKNGGAVLARLPIVPGLIPVEVADIAGDDMRLQAEAYIRGVQNAVIDLVAIRQLLAARIRMRIERGQIEQAEEMLLKLREQPTHELLSNDMGDKLAMFKRAIGRNANQQRKVDELFSVTRELLTKHINPAMLRNLESEMVAAKSKEAK